MASKAMSGFHQEGKIQMSNPKRKIHVHDIANLVAQFVTFHSGGDPATALSAICEVTAELMKVGGPALVPKLKESYLQHLERFLKLPNSLIVAVSPETQQPIPPPKKIILPGQ